MTMTVGCPSCGRNLLVPPELVGRSVRCPDCRTVFPGEPKPAFEAPATEPKTIAPPTEPTMDEGGAPSGPAAPVAVTASEPPPAPPGREARPELRRCPFCGERIRTDAARCRFCGEDVPEEDDRPWEGPYRTPVRRDCEPHRGQLLLTLGILSLVLLMCWMVAVVGLTLGIVAWVLARKDEQKIQAGTMDPEGRGLVQAAKVLGIVGTILNSLYLAGCGAYIGFVIYMASTQQ
jgi:hypothetical protein